LTRAGRNLVVWSSVPTGALAFAIWTILKAKSLSWLPLARPSTTVPEYKLGKSVTYIALPRKFIAGTIGLSIPTNVLEALHYLEVIMGSRDKTNIL